jgi:hypothetical protein
MTTPVDLTAYADWTGSFPQLVSQANAILRAQGQGEDVLTERTARHYQSEKLLGPGVKEGRTARFGYADLAALVATKTLAKTVGLKNASSLFAQSQAMAPEVPLAKAVDPGTAAMDTVARLLAGAQTPYATTAHYQDGTAAVAALNWANTSALGDAAPVHAFAAAAPSLLRGHAPTLSAVASPAAPAPRAFTHHSPSPWLTVALDEAALALASPAERQRAAAALTALAATVAPR